MLKNFILLCCALMVTLISLPASADTLEADFKTPPHSSGIRAFWWWLNSNVTKEAITRDLEEMKDKGFNGAMIFDADGSSQHGNKKAPTGPVFGGPKWTELFVHACQEAKRLDLELSLNIQSGWNLGGPKVTEEEATQELVWSKISVEGGTAIEQVLGLPVEAEAFYRDVVVLAVPGHAEATTHPIKDLDLKNASRELGGSAPDCRFLLETDPGEPGDIVINSDAIINLTAKMDNDGILHWNAPEGQWQILRFGHTNTDAHVSTHSAGWGGRVLNYLNPKSLDAYWTRNIDPLFKAIGPLAGTTMRYVHTDSWEGGGMNWTPGFAQTFKKKRGYDVLPWLAVLDGYVLDSREDSNAFLADFRKTISDLVAEHYEHLAKLSGQYGMGTHPESAGPHAGTLDGLKNYGHSEIMMSEFWSPSPHRPTPDNRFFVKQASSAAHTYGKRLVGAEAFTTIGPHWNDIPWAHMKPSFDTEICSGLNLLFNHTFTCSPAAMGMPGQEYFAGTHFNPQVTWWNESPALIDYFKRCQYLAQQGDFVADVVYYYGDHVPNIARRKGDDPAGALPGYDYDVLSEELLLGSLKVNKAGHVTLPSGMEYRVLVLPDHKVLSLGALKKVDKLVRNGATVLGPKPIKAVSLEGAAKGKKKFQQLADRLWGQSITDRGSRKVGKGRIAWGMKSRDFLSSNGVMPDVEFSVDALGMDWIHYRISDADVYFVAELDGKARNLNATFRVNGRVPELWNAVDGSIREAQTFAFVDGRTELPLEFDAFGSMFVVFRKEAKADRNDGSNFPTWQTQQLIAGPWEVSFDSQWGGPKDSVRFETLTDWSTHSDEGIKYYSGKAVYCNTFNLANELVGKPLAIELGQVKDVGMARVTLNGIDLGVVWRPPFRVDISKAVQSGDNNLEVMVVNSWRNRLIGDNQLPEEQRLTKTNIKIREKTISARQTKWELEESGLLGPVKIVRSVESIIK